MKTEDINVLHVDDDPSITSLISDYLSHEYGLTVDEINNPEEVLEALDGSEYDVVVSDYDMPEMDGLELFEDIESEYPEIPFILFTGNGSEEIASQAISAGVTDYVQKKSGTLTYDILIDNIEEAVELRYQQKELERQNQRLSEFAGMVSHDIRNPLNVAIGRVEMLEGENDALERSLDRIEQIIDDSLDYARCGKKVDKNENLSVSDIAKDCWENLETFESELGVYPSETIEGDPSRIKTMFENIYRNAIEHGGEDVKIQFGPIEPIHTETRVSGEDSRGFYIQDDGPGIPEEERDNVFDSGYSTKDGGTGFGLSIVNQVVESHDWDIKIEDSNLGGVRFEIYTD